MCAGTELMDPPIRFLIVSLCKIIKKEKGQFIKYH